ncbi:uncharacterized protein LOC126653898 [Mercurialis annua]|uniref:uncharacterized protein LOC126653898 n=1 Tax=Mercurialis annua TaxID=3986 RepID=UPI002160E977|nr:uncharacterized protein LOC126653898 [Mercurialis annua]
MQSVPSNLPVGWRFQPTNEELLDHYLKKKRLGLPIHGIDIQELQIFNCNPLDLLDGKSSNEERYFFCIREFYLKNGRNQRKRTAGAGYWKRTGESQSVISEESDEEIGTKRIFVYHTPNPTKWVIHEYEYTAQLHSPIKGDFVLCKLMINRKKKTYRNLKKNGYNSNGEKTINKTKDMEIDYENSRSNKKRRCLSNRNAALAYGDGEPNNYLSTYFQNLSPDNLANLATYTNHSKHSLFECSKQNAHQKSIDSIYNISDTNFPMQSHCEITNPFEEDHVSSLSLVSDPSMVNFKIPSDSEITNLNDIHSTSTIFTIPSDSEITNPNDIHSSTKFTIPSDSEITNPNDIHSSTKFTIPFDSEITNPNDIHSSTKFTIPSDSENANIYGIYSPTKFTNPSDSENMNPCDIYPSGTKFTIPSGSENTNPYDSDPPITNFKNPSDSKFTNPFDINPSATNFTIPTYSESTISNEIDNLSTFNKEEFSCFDLQNQNSSKTSKMPLYKKCKPSSQEAFGLENQNPYELTSVSTHNKGETGCLGDFDFESNLSEMTVDSSHENGDLRKTSTISASAEGECRIFEQTPSDFDLEYLNRYQNTDMSSYQEKWTFNVQETALQKTENQHILQKTENQHIEMDISILQDIRSDSFTFNIQESISENAEKMGIEEASFCELDLNFWND